MLISPAHKHIFLLAHKIYHMLRQNTYRMQLICV